MHVKRSNSQSGEFSPGYICIGIKAQVRFLSEGLESKFDLYYQIYNSTYHFRRILARSRGECLFSRASVGRLPCTHPC